MNCYFEILLDIKERYKDWSPRCDPYSIYDWNTFLTPIEKNVWDNIRELGLPFYPQHPVGKYFVDFADPIKKIGIEVDSKYHKDPAKDKKRQEEIEQEGWFIVRIIGKQTYNLKEEEAYWIHYLKEHGEDYDSIKKEVFDPDFSLLYGDVSSRELLTYLKKYLYSDNESSQDGFGSVNEGLKTYFEKLAERFEGK